MTRNTFGNLFTLTTFGESHGEAVGGVIDGMPAGIDIDLEFIQQELNRRRPGQSSITTSRQEADKVELLSGVFEGKSTGCPIGFIVRNTNQHSQDYENLRCLFRPSHADYTYEQKYGVRDHRGGGRSSARIPLPVLPSAAVWVARWPNSYSDSWGSAYKPTPHRWGRLHWSATITCMTSRRRKATLYAVRMQRRRKRWRR